MPLIRRGLLLAGAAILLSAGVAQAQVQSQAPRPPTRIRGTIAALDGNVLSVVTREGPTVKLSLPDGFQPTALKVVPISSIKPNDFVATVASPAADGTLQSTYVLIFPEALRGSGEGHHNWDLAPGSSMTNATVTSTVKSSSGRTLKMVYKGTPIDVVVPPSAPTLVGIPATRADLKPGAKVFSVANKQADGSYLAFRVTVAKNGVNPPQ